MSFWGKDPSGAVSCQSPDINQDGNVNLADFSIMMGQWTTDQEIVNCGADYDCLYQQISNGNSAKIIITEEIESLSLIEKSEVKVELVNNKYQVSMKVLDLKEIKKEKFSIRSIVGSISKTCPQIINNLNKVESKSAICIVNSAKEAKQLAIDGLTENAIKNYNCKGGLVDAINEICVTPDFPHFPPGVRKPAVYLYPKEKSEIEVNLSINGFITKSEPDYLLGWNVTAEPTGLIDNEYDYLFYEAQLNNIELPNKGWVVEYSNLENWFNKNLPQLGLNQKEIFQFKEYWLSELKESNYYEIKLLDEIFLTENMNLIINPQPDTIIRRNFYFKPLNEKMVLAEPIISTPERIGFTVVEWGGLLDK